VEASGREAAATTGGSSVKRIIAVMALALLAGGCSTKFEVQSDTGWSGYVNDHSVAGTGSATYSAEIGQAATFQKNSEGGYLKARAKGWYGDDRWVTTTAPYGVVTVSTK
jgi:hypothetical protein